MEELIRSLCALEACASTKFVIHQEIRKDHLVGSPNEYLSAVIPNSILHSILIRLLYNVVRPGISCNFVSEILLNLKSKSLSTNDKFNYFEELRVDIQKSLQALDQYKTNERQTNIQKKILWSDNASTELNLAQHVLEYSTQRSFPCIRFHHIIGSSPNSSFVFNGYGLRYKNDLDIQLEYKDLDNNLLCVIRGDISCEKPDNLEQKTQNSTINIQHDTTCAISKQLQNILNTIPIDILIVGENVCKHVKTLITYYNILLFHRQPKYIIEELSKATITFPVSDINEIEYDLCGSVDISCFRLNNIQHLISFAPNKKSHQIITKPFVTVFLKAWSDNMANMMEERIQWCIKCLRQAEYGIIPGGGAAELICALHCEKSITANILENSALGRLVSLGMPVQQGLERIANFKKEIQLGSYTSPLQHWDGWSGGTFEPIEDLKASISSGTGMLILYYFHKYKNP
eukprot:gb/GECH01009342.1/.p1 GENE.gb/GECH01009342.1/~~gb/GECH01009342.1/.p1  ORF type:complete len:460 (+),score=42.22 gb/GECH01009342.1/:1-1380(+)